MNKKLVAVAVAGLFAAPVAALAQSSVTISGLLKGGVEDLKYRNFGGGVVGGRNGSSSNYGIVDDSSRIIFNVVEDLGGGMQAVGQLDARWAPDTGALGGTGNSHIGLQNRNSWGRIIFGRQDVHYFNRESDLTNKNSLRADSISLLAYAGAYGAVGSTPNGGTAIANATRTPNILHYTSPNWSGFTVTAAWSSASGAPAAAGSPASVGLASANDADLTGTHRGNAWTINPNYAASNWQVGYSYWKQKTESSVATANDQRSDRAYGSYTFNLGGGGLKVGLVFDYSKLTAVGGGATTSKRDVWSIPIGYHWGNHNIDGHYTWAQRDKATAANGLDTKATMFAIGYAYDLSKRTSVGVTYAQINNHTNAGYSFFTNGSLGLGNAGVMAGEDPRMWGLTMRHQF
jgi:predicted porin